MSINDTVKSIHRLATLRDDLGGRDTTSIVLTPSGGHNPASGGEMADTAPKWMAQTYRGKGQWGSHAGEGSTPEEALDFLLKALLQAHVAVDERRAEALALSSTGTYNHA